MSSQYKFENHVQDLKKHQSKVNSERLNVIVNEILNEGHVQKDDLTNLQ